MVILAATTASPDAAEIDRGAMSAADLEAEMVTTAPVELDGKLLKCVESLPTRLHNALSASEGVLRRWPAIRTFKPRNCIGWILISVTRSWPEINWS